MTLETAQKLVLTMQKKLIHGQCSQQDLDNAKKIRDYFVK